ncbi:MAG: Rrf2 family transcriptional regulator [Phycisphaerae bacterium]|nr:Rrf2 family transcriptional regulator [Phycisphaerae bacterium]
MKVSKSAAYALHAAMYMVRHRTQLPVTSETIAKAEGIPAGYLSKILQQLTKAGLIKAVRGKKRGYTFARQPDEINMLELLETIKKGPLFNDCLLRHCECGGTPQNCHIYSRWLSATKNIKKLFEETSLEAAAWNHPEHRFDILPDTANTKDTKRLKNKKRI